MMPMKYLQSYSKVIMALIALGLVAIYGAITELRIEELKNSQEEIVTRDISEIRAEMQSKLDSLEKKSERHDSLLSKRKSKKKRSVTLTVYHPTVGQCGSNPLVTADGSKIDLRKLNSGSLRWCAVSQDLQKHYKFGTRIFIRSKNPKIHGIWEVHDLMAKSHRNKVDLLMPVGEMAYEGKINIEKVEG